LAADFSNANTPSEAFTGKLTSITKFFKINLNVNMPKIAVIGGSGFSDFSKNEVIFLQRHGKDIPPHKINHKENILSLKKKGAEIIIGINSVGSLKKKIKPGSVVIPDDYINLKNIQTYYNIEVRHITPGLDEEIRKKIIAAACEINLKVVESGVYIQAI